MIDMKRILIIILTTFSLCAVIASRKAPPTIYEVQCFTPDSKRFYSTKGAEVDVIINSAPVTEFYEMGYYRKFTMPCAIMEIHPE